ncbi:DEAD-domain-containing protein [Auriscalpium vulgare]|uniref:DEAD-domain-containing protein n=1 Tax=Auriscalpium vulgare TaxID=40419 RepID=A0ACB8R988_9AGAM|nr:DEAD-domain-containing protein [Auriscalpium vulgare]
MTPVQDAVLSLLPELAYPHDPSAKQTRDLLVKAKTGTGKTVAFLVPAIEARLNAIEAAGKKALADAGVTSDKDIETRARRVFAKNQVGTLIISPTRELATQIANEAIKLTHWHKDFEVRLFFGGASKREQMRDWQRGRRDIVVATPGRLRDVLENEGIREAFKNTQLFVLDEADTLLAMGFRDEIDAIKEYLPEVPERQTFMFSATLSKPIQQVARSVLARDHHYIDVVPKDDSPVHAHIPQYHTVLPSAEDQVPHILRLVAHDQLINAGRSKVIIFLNTTKQTQLFATLFRELAKVTLPAARNTQIYEIHSKRPQEGRTNTSNMFRKDEGGASILVTSDVSARGVDYPGVTRVIQVGMPGGTEQYIHRVGRTGRAGTTTGRGDLVLLPWEIGFVSWQLTDVPLKPLPTNELTSQVSELAAKYDANPEEFFKGIKLNDKPHHDPRRRFNTGPRLYPNTQAKTHEELPSKLAALLENVDEDAIKETLGSLLGYYLAKAPELRVQKEVIVQGLKDWTTGAMGLPTPPYISAALLERLGYKDGRTRNFGGERKRSFPSRNESHWMGRGSTKGREGGGFQGEREGGFRADREGGFRAGREGGFRGDREGGGFRAPREGGFRAPREGGFRAPREGGDREGGFHGQPRLRTAAIRTSTSTVASRISTAEAHAASDARSRPIAPMRGGR